MIMTGITIIKVRILTTDDNLKIDMITLWKFCHFISIDYKYASVHSKYYFQIPSKYVHCIELATAMVKLIPNSKIRSVVINTSIFLLILRTYQRSNM